MILVKHNICNKSEFDSFIQLFTSDDQFIEYMTERAFYCEMEFYSFSDEYGKMEFTVIFSKYKKITQSTINNVPIGLFNNFIDILKQYAIENPWIAENLKMDDVKWKDIDDIGWKEYTEHCPEKMCSGISAFN